MIVRSSILLLVLMGSSSVVVVDSFAVIRSPTTTIISPITRIENQKQQQKQQQAVSILSFPLFVASSTTASVSTYQSDDNNSNNIVVAAGSVGTTQWSSSNGSVDSTISQSKQTEQKEGGIFSFNTKYGKLNLFSLYYGFLAIALGIPWYIALTIYSAIQKVFKYRFDKNMRIPTFMNHLWGVTLMKLTCMFPRMENRHILQQFYKEKRCAMFVANHVSWMDIPFLGATIGWRNYKLIAKKELSKVPILSKAIIVAGNLMVDRKDKKSGLKTLKRGIEYLKDGVHLCTFPEGTRARDGRLMPFKNGAFKMAHKAGAPIIPITIVNANAVHPAHWIFPYRPAYKRCKVIVHEPIESIGISEDELATKVRTAMINGLPPNQQPV